MKARGPIGNFFARIFGWGGRSWGDERGPRPGDGAVIHHSSGEADLRWFIGRRSASDQRSQSRSALPAQEIRRLGCD